MPIPLIAPLIAAGASVVGQKILGIGADQRQYDQQERLQGLQLKGAKEMTDYNTKANYDSQMKMWNDTNYEAQMKHLENAGLNPGLLYGGGGGGGSTTGSGAVTGNVQGSSASDEASRQNANTNTLATAGQMGMMLAQQQVLQTQAEKNKADANLSNTQAAKVGGVDTQEATERTTGLAFQNAINKAVGVETEYQKRQWDYQSKGIEFEKQNLGWESTKAEGYASGEATDHNNLINKAIKAGFDKTVQDLTNAKSQNKIQEATAAIEEFKANLAKNGIAPDSPWYVKILGDLLDKVGLNPMNAIKGAIK